MRTTITGRLIHTALFKVQFLLLFVALSSCASVPSDGTKLKHVLASAQTIEVSVEFEEDGLVVIQDVMVNGSRMNFILDTGATRSALFESQYNNLFDPEHVPEQINVHGISEIVGRPVVTLPTLGLGDLTFKDLSFVILPNRKKSSHYDGIIGMDILKDFSLHFSRREGALSLIPKDVVVEPPSSWQDILLFSNPFKEDGRAFHFFEIELSGHPVPVLLDTGSEYNVMNWGVNDHPELKKVYDRLRRDWEYQGATGVFRPSIKMRANLIKSNEVIWQNMEFLVLNLDGLRILGMEDEFLSIASLNFFENEEFLIDFERDVIFVKPDYERRRLIEPTIYYQGVHY